MAKEKMNLPKFYDFVEKVAYAGVVVSGLIGFFLLVHWVSKSNS